MAHIANKDFPAAHVFRSVAVLGIHLVRHGAPAVSDATYTASLYGATCSGFTATPTRQLARPTLDLVNKVVGRRFVR